MKVSTITLDTYKQKIGSGDAFNLSDSFNGRVGDEQVPLTVLFKERGLLHQFDDNLVPFLTGFVGNLDENDQVTAETGEAVSYVGSRDDVIGLGRVKMNLPGTMFPQEGYFYGFLGLQTADNSKRVSTFTVWFRVYNGNPDMFVNKAPFRTELQKFLDELQGRIDDADGTLNDWKQKLTELFDKLTSQGIDTSTLLATLKQQIQSQNLFTKSDFVAVQQQIDDAIAKLNPTTQAVSNVDNLDIAVDGGVQEPFMTNLSAFKATISSNGNVAKIGLLQDIHFQRSIYPDEYGQATNRGLVHIQHMGKLKDQLNAVVYNGDNVHGREAKSSTTKRIKQLVNTSQLTFGDLPVLWTLGNHDDNGVYFDGVAKRVNTLTLAELKAAFGIGQTYAYHDLPEQKVRVIVMDAFENPEIYNADSTIKYDRSYNSIFSGNQLKWIGSTLLSTPSDYSVIAFMHCPPEGFDGNLPYDKYHNINHELMLGLYRAFISGTSFTGTGSNSDYPVTVTADFTSRGQGDLVGIVCGHEHHDLAPQVHNGIRVIERTCNLGFGTGRIIGDVSEDAFDVIEVDGGHSHVKFNRFGAGNSLEFDY